MKLRILIKYKIIYYLFNNIYKIYILINNITYNNKFKNRILKNFDIILD